MTFIEGRRGVWDEELMCDVETAAPVRRGGARALGGGLRAEVSARGLARAADFEVTRGAVPSVIYAPVGGGHGNFIEASYRRICADAEWSKRLRKAHTAKRQARPAGAREEVRAWCELDAATSSDALLMNVFCYPAALGKRLSALLGVPAGCRPEFGYRPGTPLARGLRDRTEIDMRLPGLMVEAKLTESGFQCAPLRLVERYVAFDEVFAREALEIGPRGVESYQLVRGVMAARATGDGYCVLCDARRPDLIEAWFRVMVAVKDLDVRARLKLTTWQEVAGVLPARLRVFLAEKYGIA